jgi:hypothetical protein
MRTLGAARRWAKAGSGPRNGLLALNLRIHASPRFSPFLPHARARSELFCFCSICAPWVPPAAWQKRAAGPEMVCLPSNYVYTHRPYFLHFYRMHKLDLNYFVFARYAHPGCRRPHGQKWAAGPKMVCLPSNYIYTHRTDFLHFYRMCELDLNFVFFPGFAGPGAPLGAARRGAKAGSGPKNGLLALKLRIHASPRFSPFLPHVQARSEFCFFPWICGPRGPAGRCPPWGKSGQRAQKRSARPQTTYTRIAQIFSISTACVSTI